MLTIHQSYILLSLSFQGDYRALYPMNLQSLGMQSLLIFTGPYLLILSGLRVKKNGRNLSLEILVI